MLAPPLFCTNSSFCAAFLPLFCLRRRFCKHAKFSKVNAKFSKVVDFLEPFGPKFFKDVVISLIFNRLLNPRKTGVFSSEKFSRSKFLKYEGTKRGNFEHSGQFISCCGDSSVLAGCYRDGPGFASRLATIFKIKANNFGGLPISS